MEGQINWSSCLLNTEYFLGVSGNYDVFGMGYFIRKLDKFTQIGKPV